ncbi:ATP-binding protein [Telluria mixta]|uniref:histidine kinase n=1 Tax=Telluria mixta TaxID=34071 RepID=A0ABT2BY03_9BURK|nr:ATP-binding protein [Telluria mixta]MCS0629491.1 ATP-binding protein [Telluria mixta]WEM96934.1 ATP-binding protein [Telluria mixta]
MLSPALFDAVFNQSPIGHSLLSPAPDATILAVNDAFLKASGRTREELVGVSLFDAFPRNPDDPADTGETVLRRSLARVLATGQPDRLPAQRYPIPVVLPNGETGFEERFWSAVSTPVFDADGGILCIAHTTIDVTEQVRSEAALRESEARYRALTNATADVVYRMSADWSQLRQLDGRGYLKDTSAASRYWVDEYIPPEDQDRIHDAIDAAIRAKSTFELEHRVHRLDGSVGWTYSRAVPMLDARGEIEEWIGAASDITERKLAEEKLRESDRRKDEFLAMLAHELRNPLAPIGAAAALLQRARLDEGLVRKTSDIIGRQVGHMTELIDDLLDVSRVTRGQVELDEAALDMRAIVADAVEQVMPLVRTRRQQLDVDVPAQSMPVMGDAKRLVQILANLLNNAAKYTQEGGRLRLAAKVLGNEVAVDVVDNGIGMAPELVARAFDLFAQAERTSDRASGGLGLGLALVRSLVELHGGTVACESAGPGRGSRFTVTLPLLADAAGPDVPRDGAHVVARESSLTIMVVDDNVDAAETLGLLLEASGHRVSIEHDPQRALERARTEAPQVCLLDIGLPGMDGYELARRLRAQPATRHAFLVAITGYGQDSDRRLAAEAGFDKHLVKPIDLESLQNALASRPT